MNWFEFELEHVRYFDFDWKQVKMTQLASEKIILIAGSVCKDWSTMGKQNGFNGNFTMLCAVMLAICRRVRPIVFIHECTRLFPYHILEKALKGSTDHHLILDPPNHGAPVRRSRSYDAVIKPGWDIKLGREHAMTDFARLLNKCSLDAGVWLQASQEEAAVFACVFGFHCQFQWHVLFYKLEDLKTEDLTLTLTVCVCICDNCGSSAEWSGVHSNPHYIIHFVIVVFLQVDLYRYHLASVAMRGSKTDFRELLPPTARMNLQLAESWTWVQEQIQQNEMAMNLDQNPSFQAHIGIYMPCILASISHMWLVLHLGLVARTTRTVYNNGISKQVRHYQLLRAILCHSFTFDSILSCESCFFWLLT